MKSYKIAVLAGDGIGPEITQEAIKVLKVIEERNDVSFELIENDYVSIATGDAIQIVEIIRTIENTELLSQYIGCYESRKYVRKTYTVNSISDEKLIVDQVIRRDEVGTLKVYKVIIEDSDVDVVGNMIGYKNVESTSNLALKSESISKYSYTRETELFEGYPKRILSALDYDKSLPSSLDYELDKLFNYFGRY